nr:hypothetical protein [Asticcacaulis solisilvae]
MTNDQIAATAIAVGQRFNNFELEELGQKEVEAADRQISAITRREIGKCFGDDLMGQGDLIKILADLFPDRIIVEGFGYTNLVDEIERHMLTFRGDWEVDYLFNVVGADQCSTKRFCRLLEAALHPIARAGPEQKALAEEINIHLRRDGFTLTPSQEVSGYPIYSVEPIGRGVKGAAKNLIFASAGPKPEIGFADAINNDIIVLSHCESCLVYDQPLKVEGLLWADLVSWWTVVNLDSAPDPAKTLGERLRLSLQSDAERNLFGQYFKTYKARFGSRLPALIPQVYLHYDPAIVRRLTHREGLFRQRMDFLMLLPNAQRVVIEVDGSHHFAEGDRPSLPAYANMVRADRELRLLGYEVYRFGANELVGRGSEQVITAFFDGLWKAHRLS